MFIPVENLIASAANTGTKLAVKVRTPEEVQGVAFALQLGADALVLSVSRETGGFVAGLLSFNFLRASQAVDVVVPIVEWTSSGKPPHGSAAAAATRGEALRTLLRWGPGFDEARLLNELRRLRPHGTAVFVSSLWETAEGEPELDLFGEKGKAEIAAALAELDDE